MITIIPKASSNPFPTWSALFLGLMANFFVFNINALEVISIAWIIFAFGYRRITLLFGHSYCFIGFVYFSALGLLTSDILNNTSLMTSFKGVGAYLLFPTLIFFLVYNYSLARLWLLNLAYIFGSIVSSLRGFSYFGQENAKFGFAVHLTFVILSLVLFLDRTREKNQGYANTTQFFAAIIISIIGIWSNLRLLAFVAISSFIFAFAITSRKSLGFRAAKPSIAACAIGFPVSLLMLSYSFTFVSTLFLEVIPKSLIASDAYSKTLQSLAGDFGLLFAGRQEIFSAVPAWLEKPFWGWGSWAIDPNQYYSFLGKEIMISFNYDFNYAEYERILYQRQFLMDELIPTHSFILNLLVWSGLVGTIPAYLFISSFIRRLIIISSEATHLQYPLIFISIFLLWNLIFSPFGFSNRVTFALLASVSISWFVQSSALKSYQSKSS